MKILLVDNYDSFTYNLVQQLGSLGCEPIVVRNDKLSLEDVEKLNPTHIILSPGPGNPSHAGICVALIQQYYKRFPILGVCLGMQSIGASFGAHIVEAPQPVHGKVSIIKHNNKSIFSNLKPSLEVARYHSLVIDPKNFP